MASNTSNRRTTLCIVLSLLTLGLHINAADTYINFNDGHLLVFPDSCTQSISVTETQVVVIDKAGNDYNYNRSSISAIDEHLNKELPRFTSFKFIKKDNHQVVSNATGVINEEQVNVEVVGIGKWLTASFELSDPQATVTVGGVVQQSHVSRLHFDSSKEYLVYAPGDLVLTKAEDGNYDFEPYGRRYTVVADFLTDHSTRVPRIDINTVDGVNITSKDDYVDAEIIIDGAGVFPSMTDSVQIKGRGHTSWSNDPNAKNPYRLKFESKKKPLGLTAGKSWVLLANKISGSMLTNALAMKAASLIGTPAANHIIPVDLYINGVYKGSYNFTEKLGISNNSIDLEDETVATLIKLDCNYDEVSTQKFRSTPYNHYCNIKDPDFAEGNTQLTLNMIKQRFNAFCKAVKDSTDLSKHADIDYLARYLLLNELVCNYEIFHPKSGYCYHENILSEDHTFIFGPVWDFDWAFGYQTNRNYYKCKSTVDYYNIYNWGQSTFFRRLHNYPAVARRLYQLCKEFVENDIDELCDYCEEYYRYAKPSLELNVTNETTSSVDNTDYEAQWQLAATWLRKRANAVLNMMDVPVGLPGDINDDGIVNIEDVVATINYILSHDSQTLALENADLDGNGAITISDVTALINLLLAGEQ